MSWEGSLVFNNVLRTLNLDCRASYPTGYKAYGGGGKALACHPY